MILKGFIAIFVVLLMAKADFIRENKKQVVHDTSHCLIWQDDNRTKVIKKNWKDAIEFCENLELGGYDDWRLPNINEIFTISDKSKIDPAIQSEFNNVNTKNHYWTSTSWNGNHTSPIAWTFDFSDSNDEDDDKNKELLIRCVRDKK